MEILGALKPVSSEPPSCLSVSYVCLRAFVCVCVVIVVVVVVCVSLFSFSWRAIWGKGDAFVPIIIINIVTCVLEL